MPKIRSLDFVLLETSLFGVNQGYTGRFIGPRIARILGIFNLCLTVSLAYLLLNQEYASSVCDPPVVDIAWQVYAYVALLAIVIIQIRSSYRRYKMAPFGRELSHLCHLSTWSGDIYGCIGRIVFYLVLYVAYQCLLAYRKEWEGRMGWRIIRTFFDWSKFVPTATIEFISQGILLFQHEFNILCKITKGLVVGRDYGMKKLRTLNRRHASLFALYNKLAGFTGTDSLVIIESEKFLILTSLFIHINRVQLIHGHWSEIIFNYAFHVYRMERIIHLCFRGHRIILEANRFASTLDEIDPLDLVNDEFFIELQIIRKQAKLRKVQYDCNRFLKLDMKLIFQISRDLLTLIIILVQLTTNLPMGTSVPSNATVADDVNTTEHFLDIEIHSLDPKNVYPTSTK